MRIVPAMLLVAVFPLPALAAEDAASATKAVSDAVAVTPPVVARDQVATDTESLFSDVHGSVSVMIGTGGTYGVEGAVSGTMDDRFHFSLRGSKSREPGLAGDVYRPLEPFGQRTRPLK